MKYPQLVRMPSAVSDWLEEQLDARGIDAAVYTRYVLSLLRRDAFDLVNTEQDQHPSKEVRHCGRSRKRFRRPATWWSHVRADVEELRRSAAVECLMSASDQKCGIESLVDELCEKLKHFESSESSDKLPSNNNNTSTNNNNNNNNNNNSSCIGGNKKQTQCAVERSDGVCSPSELATRYYAAFPPLTAKSATEASLMRSLLPRLYQSSGGGSGGSIGGGGGGGGGAHVGNNRRRSQARKQDGMKSRCSGGRPRFACLSRAKKGFGFARSVEKSLERTQLSEWEARMSLVGQSRAGDEGYATSDTAGVDELDDGSEPDHEQRLEYDDLPVDIQELLSSPADHDPAVHRLNAANTRRSENTAAFIQCGTNITSSIWSECTHFDHDNSLYESNYCQIYGEPTETLLGQQFNSLSVRAGVEDDMSTDQFTSLPWELPQRWSDTTDTFPYMGTGGTTISPTPAPLPAPAPAPAPVLSSLVTLNHNREASCFQEVVPKQGGPCPSGRAAPGGVVPSQERAAPKEDEDLLTSTRTHFRPIKQEAPVVGGATAGVAVVGVAGGVTSSGAATTTGQYADGTTFAIRSSYEHVNYRRSDSGALYVDSGFDTPKKYMEWRTWGNHTNSNNNNGTSGSAADFVLKFCVKQNEKCCQTEPTLDAHLELTEHSPPEVPAKKRVLCDPDEFYFPGDDDLFSDSVDGLVEVGGVCECNCSLTRTKVATRLEPLFNSSAESCHVHGPRSDIELSLFTNNNNNNSNNSSSSNNTGTEGSTTTTTINNSTTVTTISTSTTTTTTAMTAPWRCCDKCNNNWQTAGGWFQGNEAWTPRDTQTWHHIWSSSEEELCRACAGAPAGPGAPPGDLRRLRAELSQDGDQLLSDLSCLQRVYMEQLPSAELSCDFTDCHLPGNERKRRHSSSQRRPLDGAMVAAAVARNSWTTAAAGSCAAAEVPPPPPSLLRPVTL